MSHPWSITPSAYGKQGTPNAWRKDTTRVKEAEQWRDESDPEDGFKMREKIIGDDGLCLINKLKMEDKDMQESLEKLDRRIKRTEENAPGSAEHIRLLRHYLDQMDEKIIKGLEANLDICLHSLDTQKRTLEVSKNYIALLEKLAKERSARIIYLETFIVALQTKIRNLEGEAPSK
ncbi:hypothetical protein QYE76_043630 [Lolium multiflorum]|uniref:Uncharacterized protein n=1 Tax=Lolium multiflorum TaxID=4521 RepID=A0AAD8TJ36_LOLMU|nr:hypothetical protein QYE76_043630 [Lolium multiflorum]